MRSAIQTLRLKPGKEKSIRLRHPWVYSGALKRPPESSGPAQLADSQGNILAAGFAEEKASIAFRTVVWADAAIDLRSKAFWRERFECALVLRRHHLDLAKTDCFRLIHGEADAVPGVVADVYGDCVVLQSGWTGAEICVPVWTEILYDLGFKNILRKRAGTNKPGHWNEPDDTLVGKIPQTVQVWENGIRFEVDLVQGQKTGFFLDQRDNRALLQSLAAGRNVVNTFCYTGGFSLAAAVGGAERVVSVDISSKSLEQLERNWELNHLQTPHQIICADAFAWLRTLPQDRFDFIILDPPAFATSKAALPRATRGYKDILLQSFKAVRRDGLVMVFSCSQHISPDLLQKIAFGAALDADRQVLVLKKLCAGPDHPFSLYHPEGEYLKGLLLNVR